MLELREAELKQCEDTIRTYYNQIQELYKDLSPPEGQLNTGNSEIQSGLAGNDR